MLVHAQVRAAASSGAAATPRTLSYNPAENAVLVSSDADGGSYQLYMVPKDGRSDPSPVRPQPAALPVLSCNRPSSVLGVAFIRRD